MQANPSLERRTFNFWTRGCSDTCCHSIATTSRPDDDLSLVMAMACPFSRIRPVARTGIRYISTTGRLNLREHFREIRDLGFAPRFRDHHSRMIGESLTCVYSRTNRLPDRQPNVQTRTSTSSCRSTCPSRPWSAPTCTGTNCSERNAFVT